MSHGLLLRLLVVLGWSCCRKVYWARRQAGFQEVCDPIQLPLPNRLFKESQVGDEMTPTTPTIHPFGNKPVAFFHAWDIGDHPICEEFGFVIIECHFQYAKGLWEFAGHVNGRSSYIHSTADEYYRKHLVIAWSSTRSRWELTVDGLCLYILPKDWVCPSEGWVPIPGQALDPAPVFQSVFKDLDQRLPAPHLDDLSGKGAYVHRWFWNNLALGRAGISMYFDMYLCANPTATELEITLQHMSTRTAYETAASIHLATLLGYGAERSSVLPPVPGVRVVYPNEVSFQSLMMEFWPPHRKNVFVQGVGFSSESIDEGTQLYGTPSEEDRLSIGTKADPRFMSYVEEFGAALFELAVPEPIYDNLINRADRLRLRRTDPNVPKRVQYLKDRGTAADKLILRQVAIWIDPLVVIMFRPHQDQVVRLKGGTIMIPEPEQASFLLQKMIGEDIATRHQSELSGTTWMVRWLDNGDYTELTFMPASHKLTHGQRGKIKSAARDKFLNPALGSSSHFALQLPHRDAQWLAHFFETENVRNWHAGTADNPDRIVFNFFFVELTENCFFDVIPNNFKPFSGNRLPPIQRSQSGSVLKPEPRSDID